MRTQSTQIHIHLWHRDFWLMVVANMLLAASVYMQLPMLPQWLIGRGWSYGLVGAAMGAFGLGLYCLGPLCSYLVQRFRRNVVCIWCIVSVAVCAAALYYLDAFAAGQASIAAIVTLRFALGAAFGLAQMVLSSTLIIDTSESFQRTEANHISAWFYRFALSLGPLAGLLVWRYASFCGVALCSMVSAVAAAVLVRLVKFPFRTPEEGVRLVSLDRFFLPQGWPLFVNLMLVSAAVGLVLSSSALSYCNETTAFEFFAMMMVGFLLALLSQRFVFQNAELKSEVVTGLILVGAALHLLLTRNQAIVVYAAPTLFGCGVGIVGARFLLFFVKLSRHCQRGTSQSTFMLGWESGVALGIAIGIALFQCSTSATYAAALALTAIALLLYMGFTHRWFMRNKNR